MAVICNLSEFPTGLRLMRKRSRIAGTFPVFASCIHQGTFRPNVTSLLDTSAIHRVLLVPNQADAIFVETRRGRSKDSVTILGEDTSPFDVVPDTSLRPIKIRLVIANTFAVRLPTDGVGEVRDAIS